MQPLEALGRPASDNRKLPVSDNRKLHTRRTRRSRRTCRGESEGASAPRAAGPAKALGSPSKSGWPKTPVSPAGAVPSRYGAHRTRAERAAVPVQRTPTPRISTKSRTPPPRLSDSWRCLNRRRRASPCCRRIARSLPYAVERRYVPAGANPARQLSLQPEAVGSGARRSRRR